MKNIRNQLEDAFTELPDDKVRSGKSFKNKLRPFGFNELCRRLNYLIDRANIFAVRIRK